VGAADEGVVERIDPAVLRRAALAGAFGREVGGASSFAAASAVRFTPETLSLARSLPSFVSKLEAALDAFLAGDTPRQPLWPMERRERLVVHELARAYQLATGEYEPECRAAPSGIMGGAQLKSVHLFRTATCGWPGMRLSDAAAASEDEVSDVWMYYWSATRTHTHTHTHAQG